MLHSELPFGLLSLEYNRNIISLFLRFMMLNKDHLEETCVLKLRSVLVENYCHIEYLLDSIPTLFTIRNIY